MFEGTMMDFPLTTGHLLERARTFFGSGEVVSRQCDRSIHRTTYRELHGRACRLASALVRLGVRPGERVATLSWNHSRHLEAYLAVPSMGAVLHTLNLRLHPTELRYIATHAEDKVVICDRSLLPLLQQFVKDVPTLKHVVVIGDDGPVDPTMVDYEKFLAAEPDHFDFPTLDEKSAAQICYTSGTTGHPKGVVYSHRSTVLHSMAVCMNDALGIGEADTVLPVVPMFHANAWGLPYSAVLTGAKLVFPGPHLDATSLLELMAAEKVTMAGGVPTIWLGILALLDESPKKWDLSSMRRMAIGGSAAPPAMIDGFAKRHGIEVMHAWGMTEMNPIGTVARLRREHANATDAEKLGLRSSQGYPVPFVEQRHTSDSGAILPWDGKSMGELEVRGPWVVKGYLGGEGKDRFTADGWFKTGDVVTIDAAGYMRICDRSKDVIKSGGEWISSVDLENALMAHPAVLEAAVFAGHHPKWDERPLAAIVLKPNAKATDAELLAHLDGRFPKFWMPDAFIFIDQVPRTSTGKFLKTKLRELYGNMLVKAAT
jgi:fatty-acyl-CoA synthase